jgi:hypothetical protein
MDYTIISFGLERSEQRNGPDIIDIGYAIYCYIKSERIQVAS